MSLLVNLKNITKTYHAARDYQALKGVNFTLARGEMVAIIGSSGSGKSTLMNIVGFLDHCTSGQYYFDSEDVSSLSESALAHIRNQKIGFVFQSFFLLPRLNILQNVMLPLFYREENPSESKEKSLQALAKVGMDQFIHHKPNQLSGGQQQRVAIARALVGDPEIILADEPTGSLDSKTGQDVMNLFIHLNENESRTILMVTHDKEISRQCKRIFALKDGKAIEEYA